MTLVALLDPDQIEPISAQIAALTQLVAERDRHHREDMADLKADVKETIRLGRLTNGRVNDLEIARREDRAAQLARAEVVETQRRERAAALADEGDRRVRKEDHRRFSITTAVSVTALIVGGLFHFFG